MDGKVEIEFSLQAGSRTIEASARVPAGPVPLVQIIPVIHGIASALAQVGIEEVQEEGKTVSCRAGCGACCRQAVPVTEPEAQYLAALVESLPAGHQAHVRERFRQAIERVDAAGVGHKMRNLGEYPEEVRLGTCMDYFHLGVACPFLEEESCSIHPYRPAICREYSVTSPAALCVNCKPEEIERVPIYARPTRALAGMGCDAEPADASMLPHMALIYALEWAAEHPPEEPRSTGPELLRKFLERLSSSVGADEPQAAAPRK